MTVTFRILFTEVEAECPGTVRLVLGLRGLAVELRRIDDQTGVDDCSQLYKKFTFRFKLGIAIRLSSLSFILLFVNKPLAWIFLQKFLSMFCPGFIKKAFIVLKL